MENLTVHISQEIKIVITGTRQNDSLYLLTYYNLWQYVTATKSWEITKQPQTRNAEQRNSHPFIC